MHPTHWMISTQVNTPTDKTNTYHWTEAHYVIIFNRTLKIVDADLRLRARTTRSKESSLREKIHDPRGDVGVDIDDPDYLIMSLRPKTPTRPTSVLSHRRACRHDDRLPEDREASTPSRLKRRSKIITQRRRRAHSEDQLRFLTREGRIPLWIIHVELLHEFGPVPSGNRLCSGHVGSVYAISPQKKVQNTTQGDPDFRYQNLCRLRGAFEAAPITS